MGKSEHEVSKEAIVRTTIIASLLLAAAPLARVGAADGVAGPEPAPTPTPAAAVAQDARQA